MCMVMKWEEGVVLQLDVTQWTAGWMGDTTGLHVVERRDTFFARVVIELRFKFQINSEISLQDLR